MQPLSDIDRKAARLAAAKHAVQKVKPGMVVGLGTGDTASHAIRELGMLQIPNLRCIATSNRSKALAEQCGLVITNWEDPTLSWPYPIDLAMDGTDEVDPAMQLVKGQGGALLFEKIVAANAKKFIVLADREKTVPYLGTRCSLPIEIVPFGYPQTLRKIKEWNQNAVLRRGKEGHPYTTDGGHFLVDLPLDFMAGNASWSPLDRALKQIPGVIETGFFLEYAHEIIVGQPDGSVVFFTRPEAVFHEK